MSETPRQAFTGLINTFKDRLDSVDLKYSKDRANVGECSKYIEKLSIYNDFTEGLIANGTRFLEIIAHTNELMAKADADIQSIASSTTRTDDQVFEDLDFLKRCLAERTGTDTKAIESLNDLEEIVDLLIREHKQLDEENRRLKVQLQKREKSSSAGIDDTITSNVIVTLRKENEDLKQIIIRNKQTMNMIRNQSSSSSSNSSPPSSDDDRQGDCEEQLEQLRRQSANKDQQIQELLAQLNELKKKTSDKPKPSTSSSTPEFTSSESNESTSSSHSEHSSHSSRADTSNESHSTTDSERKDREQLRKFKDGYKALAALLKEKYEKLREYRSKIVDLLKQLEKCAAIEKESLELKDLIADLRHQNQKLNDELRECRTNLGPLDEIKKQSELCNSELEKLKEREQLLARKLDMQEKHLQTLLAERENLLKLNNDMLESIAICKAELAKYRVD